MLLREIPAGETVTFQTNYLGSFLLLRTSDNADIAVQQVKVVPLGDGVLCDLDQAGVNAIGVSRMISTFGAFTNNNMRIIPLADGVIPRKVTDITIQNVGVAPVYVYMPVTGKGTTYIQTMQQTVLENSQSIFTDFFSLIPEDVSNNDRFTVDWEDGSSHTFDGWELNIMSAYLQDVQKPIIDNADGIIKKVTVITSATKKMYLNRFKPIGNI